MAERTVFVVLGAGASYAASSIYAERSDLRPPLTKELFDKRWVQILSRYPMATNAAPNILDAIEEGGSEPALSLEDYLRTRYHESNDPVRAVWRSGACRAKRASYSRKRALIAL